VGFQEIDIVSIVRPITKYAAIVTDPLEIRRQLEEAVWHATNGRKGPVWLDIPLDVQAAEVNPAELAAFKPPEPDSSLPSRVAAAASECTELLRASKRPVVLVGNGVRHASAEHDVIKWAESIGVPVLPTWKALDFIEDSHPLYVGRPGAVGQRAANFAQQTCDLFISIGARLDYGQTAYNHDNFAPRARKVVVDIDAAEIKKLGMKIDVMLAADAGHFVRELLNKTASFEAPSEWSNWRQRCQEWKTKYPIILPEYLSSPHGVNNYALVNEIGRNLGPNDLLVPGSSGACSEVTCQAIPASKGLRFINTQGLGAMGFGIPAAIGACLASGMSRTVCIDGDGGFFMNSQELVLCARFNLPVKFFVLNNNGYGSIRTTQINYFDSRFLACDPSSGLTLPDVCKTAEACGLRYHRISEQEHLSDQLRAILNSPGPAVCEVMMAPGQFTQPKVSSRQTPDGKMQTMPMEDLWPFLDRAELAANLKV
jgi:acetolactate synthase-1/2/3 large subunit